VSRANSPPPAHDLLPPVLHCCSPIGVRRTLLAVQTRSSMSNFSFPFNLLGRSFFVTNPHLIQPSLPSPRPVSAFPLPTGRFHSWSMPCILVHAKMPSSSWANRRRALPFAFFPFLLSTPEPFFTLLTRAAVIPLPFSSPFPTQYSAKTDAWMAPPPKIQAQGCSSFFSPLICFMARRQGLSPSSRSRASSRIVGPAGSRIPSPTTFLPDSSLTLDALEASAGLFAAGNRSNPRFPYFPFSEPLFAPLTNRYQGKSPPPLSSGSSTPIRRLLSLAPPPPC